MRTSTQSISLFEGWKTKLADFNLLVKFRLTLLVLFSAVMSYAIVATGELRWAPMLLLTIGGFLVTGAANALNQVLERDFDKLMNRTMNRPLAAGRMTVSGAVLMAGLMAVAGITCLSMFNPLTGFLGTVSLISYAFIYTPMKRSTPFAVAVGAIPGALPNVIGCVAFEQTLTTTALMLFVIQFLWQFPHFWAVAWLADEDYKKAGFNLLPSKNGEKDASVGLVSGVFSAALVLFSLLCGVWGWTGTGATIALVAINLYWTWACFQLYRMNSREAARKQMFISFLHLPFSLIVLLLDKMI